jgi:two-component system, chemotaxis family, protein-glutamate methylesterase/glutaminase
MTGKKKEKIRVLVVDDSALMNRQISTILQSDPVIEVIGRAKDGVEALTLAKELAPDVITLDVEMPNMNGITALKHIMIKYAIPTVMISALTREGSRTSFDALRYGAVDVIAKPSRREDENLDSQKKEIISRVKKAASIRLGRSKYLRITSSSPAEKMPKGLPDQDTCYIGIGTGTGGYCSLLKIIPALSSSFSSVLIANLLTAEKYIDAFVSYLDMHSSVPVKNGSTASHIEKGTCYIISGESRLSIAVNGDRYLKFQPANHISDPIDYLFSSIALIGGANSVGIILTGAGKDGAEGLSILKKAGGTAVIQDINNCMDPEMPLAALEKGSVQKILPDYMIADFIMDL